MDQGAALFQSIADCDEKTLKTLLSSKADANAVNRHGCTPLSYAIGIHSSIEIVELLISFGANVNEIYRKKSLLSCGMDRAKGHNILLHHGVIFTEIEKRTFEKIADEWPHARSLLTAHDIMRERVARCRSLCIALWKAPFKQRDCKVWWIKTMVWPTRHDTVWTAHGSIMPEGYD